MNIPMIILTENYTATTSRLFINYIEQLDIIFEDVLKSLRVIIIYGNLLCWNYNHMSKKTIRDQIYNSYSRYLYTEALKKSDNRGTDRQKLHFNFLREP